MDTSVLYLVIITTILFIVRTVISAYSQDINIMESFNLNSMPNITKHMLLQVLFIIPFITFIITLVKYNRIKNKINDEKQRLEEKKYRVPNFKNEYSVFVGLSVFLLIIHLILSLINLYPLRTLLNQPLRN